MAQAEAKTTPRRGRCAPRERDNKSDMGPLPTQHYARGGVIAILWHLARPNRRIRFFPEPITLLRVPDLRWCERDGPGQSG